MWGTEQTCMEKWHFEYHSHLSFFWVLLTVLFSLNSVKLVVLFCCCSSSVTERHTSLLRVLEKKIAFSPHLTFHMGRGSKGLFCRFLVPSPCVLFSFLKKKTSDGAHFINQEQSYILIEYIEPKGPVYYWATYTTLYLTISFAQRWAAVFVVLRAKQILARPRFARAFALGFN